MFPPLMDSLLISKTALIKNALEFLHPEGCFKPSPGFARRYLRDTVENGGRENGLFIHFHHQSARHLLNNALISGLAVNSPVIKMRKVDVAALDGWEQASCLFALTDIFPLQWKHRQPLSINIVSVFQSGAEDSGSLNHKQCFSKTTY